MLTVHHLENSRSQRVLWLLEELGLPHDVRRHARDPRTMLAPSALLQVHPLGKSPVLVDDTAGLTVAETGAIAEYLLDACPGTPLRPAPGTSDFLRYRYWLHFAEGSAMPPLLLKLVFDKVASAPMPFFVRPVARGIAAKVLAGFVTPNLVRQLAFMEAELASHPWFAGEHFTAADVMMSFPLEAAAQRAGLTATSHPALHRWLQTIHARPAWQRALARGGPYAFA
jgi:glutathione S-transferase